MLEGDATINSAIYAALHLAKIAKKQQGDILKSEKGDLGERVFDCIRYAAGCDHLGIALGLPVPGTHDKKKNGLDFAIVNNGHLILVEVKCHLENMSPQKVIETTFEPANKLEGMIACADSKVAKDIEEKLSPYNEVKIYLAAFILHDNGAFRACFKLLDKNVRIVTNKAGLLSPDHAKQMAAHANATKEERHKKRDGGEARVLNFSDYDKSISAEEDSVSSEAMGKKRKRSKNKENMEPGAKRAKLESKKAVGIIADVQKLVDTKKPSNEEMRKLIQYLQNKIS